MYGMFCESCMYGETAFVEPKSYTVKTALAATYLKRRCCNCIQQAWGCRASLQQVASNEEVKRTNGSLTILDTSGQRKCGIAYGWRHLRRRNPHSSRS
jgi:hypothetical protein